MLRRSIARIATLAALFGTVARPVHSQSVGRMLVTDVKNAAGDMFGSERLEQALAKAAGQGADEVMVAVETQITRFRSGVELTDDATMMVVKVG